MEIQTNDIKETMPKRHLRGSRRLLFKFPNNCTFLSSISIENHILS